MVMDSKQFQGADVFRRSIQFQAGFCLFPRDERLVAVFGNSGLADRAGLPSLRPVSNHAANSFTSAGESFSMADSISAIAVM
jgi:hypothetical protein